MTNLSPGNCTHLGQAQCKNYQCVCLAGYALSADENVCLQGKFAMGYIAYVNYLTTENCDFI